MSVIWPLTKLVLAFQSAVASAFTTCILCLLLSISHMQVAVIVF